MERPIWAGVVLGISLGGFLDGIMLHQVLQWHHMLSSADDLAIAGDMRLNIMADGFFHLATWLAALAGLALLWHARAGFAAPGGGRALGSGLLIGAGMFNLVEGVVNHHLLGLHHVRTDSDHRLLWDLAFLASGAVLVGLGWTLARRSRTKAATVSFDRPRRHSRKL